MKIKSLYKEPSVSCDVCLKEVPAESVETFEAADYVLHFCGLECYQQWHKQVDKKNALSEGATKFPKWLKAHLFCCKNLK